MYEFKASKSLEVKKPQKKQTLETNKKEIFISGLKIAVGISIFGAIAFGGFKLFYKPPEVIWTNYDSVLSTGDHVLHQQTKSIKNVTSDSPSTDNPNAGMFLSIKKIDNKDAVWFVDHNNDFECISTVYDKCSIDISFDNSPAKSFTYDGGTMRTIYMIDAKYLVNKIKASKEIKVVSRLRRVEMSPTEKSQMAMNNNGKYVDSFSKENTFKVVGLHWD
jgi:hypothetical protein